MQLYAITDRSLLASASAGPPSVRPEDLGELARGWAQGGVSYIQVREKDLSVDELALWCEAVMRGVAASRDKRPEVLINGTPRCAIAVGADGMHLPAGWTADAIRAARHAFAQHGKTAIVSVACHSDAEAVRARDLGADVALFSPIFEKRLRLEGSLRQEKHSYLENNARAANALEDAVAGHTIRPGMGLAKLQEACRLATPLPIFALGGVNVANAPRCEQAGAAGVAAIRMFMQDGGHRETRLAEDQAEPGGWRSLLPVTGALRRSALI